MLRLIWIVLVARSGYFASIPFSVIGRRLKDTVNDIHSHGFSCIQGYEKENLDAGYEVVGISATLLVRLASQKLMNSESC